MTFKANAGDMRDAHSLEITPTPQVLGSQVQPFDPGTDKEVAHQLKYSDFRVGTNEDVEGGDAMVIITEWYQCRALDLDRLKLLMRSPTVVDLSTVCRPAEMVPVEYAHSRITC
ncbi:UDP binding domain-containing protein [Caulobacter henricii]|uniref:UDP binding domain-containing protein n=1 Tax=Caulobacter henricii TaxID=69395 RepID=UPI001F30DA35|nr:UDP binding domain-containing protein [Caulobacter henricii]